MVGFGFSTGVEFALEILPSKGAGDGLGCTTGCCFDGGFDSGADARRNLLNNFPKSPVSLLVSVTPPPPGNAGFPT